MKNITKTTAIFTALMGLSATASASDTARFVVSHEVAKTQVASAIQATSQGANETACLSAYGAGEWCLPLVNNQLKSSADSISNAKETTLISNSVALNTYGLEPEEVAKLLTRDGRFGIVEVDPFVTTPTPTVTANSYGDASAQSTNDPSSDYTGFYMGMQFHVFFCLIFDIFLIIIIIIIVIIFFFCHFFCYYYYFFFFFFCY